MANIRSFRELRVYQAAMDSSMQLFELSKTFPSDERFSLTDQVRRCSRSVFANISEAWSKRRYPSHFVSKLSDAEMEANETRSWIECACKCRYLSEEKFKELDDQYDHRSTSSHDERTRAMDHPLKATRGHGDTATKAMNIPVSCRRRRVAVSPYRRIAVSPRRRVPASPCP